jgi:hypothetical protein
MKNVIIEKTEKGLEVTVQGIKTGRKIDPNSSRQLRLAELEAKRVNGELRRGRPTNSESVRQQRLNELETKRANGTLKLGRPVSSDSQRQQRLAELEMKRANGTLKLGRPKKVKIESVELVEIQAAEGGIG